MVVNKLKLANKKYKHEARRKAKRKLDKAKALKEKNKKSSAKKRRLAELEYVEILKQGLQNEAED
jgi:hypothetical protein